MSVRVRKLAKELRRAPLEVLGLLHAIGAVRYRSTEDMIPDGLADEVRTASRRGVKPLAVEGAVDKPEIQPEEKRAPEPAWVAAALTGRPLPAPVAPPLSPEIAAPLVAPSPVPPPLGPAREAALRDGERRLEEGFKRLVKEREEFARTLASQDLSRAVAQSELAALKRRLEVAEQMAQVERVRADREVARAAVEVGQSLSRAHDAEAARQAILEEAAAKIAAAPASLQQDAALLELLEERGLANDEEFARAISALLSTRAGRARLGELRVQDPAGWRALLREMIVLTSGEPGENLPSGWVGVQVAPDRAELPSPTELEKRVERLGEIWLLFGYRRVAVMGGGGLWQRLLRAGMDARVTLRFVALEATPADLMSGFDVLVAWGVGLEPERRARFEDAHLAVWEVVGDTLVDLVMAVEARARLG